MTTLRTSLGFVCLLAACVPASSRESASGAAQDAEQPAPRWTMLIYAANDDPSRDLAAAFAADAEEWARFVGGSRVFRVMVQRDYSEHDAGNPPSERYVLFRGKKLHPDTLEEGAQALGETDTTQPGTLRDFLEAGIRRFPAERYWVVVTGHGDNWLGLATDGSASAGQRLPLAGLVGDLDAAVSGALQEVRERVGGSSRLDVVQFDTCRMGSIEVATALGGAADYLVASQENEPNAGHPYGAFYSLAQLHLGTSTRNAVSEVVSDYVRSYNDNLSTRSAAYVGTSVTSVALELANLDPLVSVLAELAEGIREERPEGLSCGEIEALRAFSSDLARTQEGRGSVAASSGLDLGSLLEAIAIGGTDGVELSPETQEIAQRALDLVGRPDDRRDPNRRYGFTRLVGFPDDGPFVTEAHSIDPTSQRHPTGLSILFGDGLPLVTGAEGSRPIETYRALAFEEATSWTGVLDRCIARRKACLEWTGSPFDPQNPCREP